MILYGLYGFTHHGWSRLLTVMGPEGAEAIADHIEPGPDISAVTGAGRLPQYYEKRSGALAGLVERYRIIVLQPAEWNAKKGELGDAIL
ncbi:MAG: hypothetical protein QNJ67_15515 [Kiloniellales bacterium]|nr:hypothetical protein [Kiloniellales bacterium]